MKPLRSLVLAAVIAVGLTACSGSNPDPKPDPTETPSAQAATGDEIDVDAYAFTAPKGWDRKDDLAPSADVLVIDPDQNDGFAENFNVIKDPTILNADGDIDAIGRGAEKSLELAKATDVVVGDPIVIDGQEAATITARFSVNGTKYRTLQYALEYGKTGYVLTFSFSDDVSAADQKKLAESVLTTWTWAD